MTDHKAIATETISNAIRARFSPLYLSGFALI